jgi:hypothetical protein
MFWRDVVVAVVALIIFALIQPIVQRASKAIWGVANFLPAYLMVVALAFAGLLSVYLWALILARDVAGLPIPPDYVDLGILGVAAVACVIVLCSRTLRYVVRQIFEAEWW